MSSLARPAATPAEPIENVYGRFTADGIGLYNGKLVCVQRLNFPQGLALVGGKREARKTPAIRESDLESAMDCIQREYPEECGLQFRTTAYLGRYDAPNRDPRGRKISDVYVGEASGILANELNKTIVRLIEIDDLATLRDQFVFDHYTIICDWLRAYHRK